MAFLIFSPKRPLTSSFIRSFTLTTKLRVTRLARQHPKTELSQFRILFQSAIAQFRKSVDDLGNVARPLQVLQEEALDRILIGMRRLRPPFSFDWTIASAANLPLRMA